MSWLAAIGAEVPAAVSYTDYDTVLAVQKALKARGYDPGKLDGLFGKNTSAAIKKMQKDLGVGQSGVCDYGVLMALKVPAPAYTPTVTTAGRSASAAAKDADAVAAYAQTPADVQAAAKQVEAANAVAIPPPPAEVQIKVAEASKAAALAKTPAEVAVAKVQVQEAAKAVVSTTSYWGSPLWTNAPVKRWHALVGASVTVTLTTLLLVFLRKKK